MFHWDRMPGESAEAHTAFLAYRDLPQGERSQKVTATRLNKSESLMSRWSSQWHWVERCAAWDERLLTEADEEILKAQKEHRKEIHEISVRIRNKAILALEAKAFEDLTVEEILTIYDLTVKHDRAALGLDGRGGSGAGGNGSPGSTGAPSFVKAVLGVELERV